MTKTKDPLAALAAADEALRKDAATRAATAKREMRVAWVMSQVGQGDEYTCPDCGQSEPTAYTLMLNHGWDVLTGSWPLNAGCYHQRHLKHKDFRLFAATTDCVGCGPLVEPWSTAKRFYVMETHLYHRDVLLPWSRKWGPIDQPRHVPDDVAAAT